VSTKEDKTKLIKDNQVQPTDTGSPEVQIALMTERINTLIHHFETHKKDHISRRGLMQVVGQRKRLLEHLKKEDAKRYEQLIQKLNLRK